MIGFRRHKFMGWEVGLRVKSERVFAHANSDNETTRLPLQFVKDL